MKYLIITDVHEDADSFSFLIQHMNESYDYYLCLGDILGANGKENGDFRKCIQLLIKHHFILTLGNHELFHLYISNPNLFSTKNAFCSYVRNYLMTNGWDYSDDGNRSLSDTELAFLSSKSAFFKSERILFSHYILPDVCGLRKTFEESKEESILSIKEHFKYMQKSNLLFTFVGHTHVNKPVILSLSKQLVTVESNKKYMLDKSNPAIVFCPLLSGNNHVSWITFDSTDLVIEFHSLCKTTH